MEFAIREISDGGYFVWKLLAEYGSNGLTRWVLSAARQLSLDFMKNHPSLPK
jgi:hypothetical protein